MRDLKIKAKRAMGTAKRTFGKIEGLKAPFSFRDLKGSLKGKILVCPGEISKSVLEKARALGASGIVCQKIADEEISRLEKELKGAWPSSSFALLVLEEDIGKILDKIEGKTGTIEVKEKRLVIEI